MLFKYFAKLRTIIVDFPYFLAYSFYERVRFGFATRLCASTGNTKGALVLNGGSLADQSGIDAVQGDIFVCNEFCRTEWFAECRPKYYVFADQQYYSGAITRTLHPVRDATLTILNERTNWPMIVYFPLEARLDKLAKRLNNPQLTISYYSKAPLPGKGYIARSALFKTSAMPYVANVSVVMIALAVKLGYGHLDIYGLDMTFYRKFYVDNDNQCYIKNSYFYSPDGVEPYMVSSKEEGGYKRGHASLFFQRMYQTLVAHNQLSALTNGLVKIVNHSTDSVEIGRAHV